MKFPSGFLWGCSTSAYQTEGDNRGSALWAWEARRGWEPSAKAADSWRLWRKDIDCLRQLHLNAYRFSVEWSRVEPEPDVFDTAALEHYARMARALKASGITPIACLHHFSEPAWLFQEHPDGWLDPAVPPDFVRFAERVAVALEEHVSDWITFNEPMVWLLGAYAARRFPPGKRSLWRFHDTFEKGPLLDHVLRAHNGAYQSIHREIPKARVGLVQNIADLEVARPDLPDLMALQRWDRFMHRQLWDKAIAAGCLDFLGINYYTQICVSRTRLPFFPLGVLPGYAQVEGFLGPMLFRLLGGKRGKRPRSDLGWEIVPEGFGRVVKRYWELYGKPILVTENGIADALGMKRELFLRNHLESLHQTMQGGAQVLGYLHWSLLDSYEWGSYRPRFGLFHVDRAHDFNRTPAPGSDFYARVAERNEF